MTSIFMWLRTGAVSHAYTVTGTRSLCGRTSKPVSRRFTRGGVPCGLCRNVIEQDRRSRNEQR